MKKQRGMRSAERGMGRRWFVGFGVAMGLVVLATVSLFVPRPLAQDAASGGAVRFEAVDVFVDSGARPLAAYQLTFRATRGDVKIVGIEGGEHPAFKEAPYYDPAAIQQERAVLAAFNTAALNQLPTGRTRVATVHLQIRGTEVPRFVAQFETAATHNGTAITARTSFQERSSK